MLRVACTMMQKNETALIEPWLRYHADLFGAENLYVFDNGSTDPSVLEALERGVRAGVRLNTQYAGAEAYRQKGEIIGACIRELQSRRSHDVALPLDCDEFVVLKTRDGATTDRLRILDHLQAGMEAGIPLRVRTQLFNIINRPGEFGATDYLKTIVPLDGTFVSTDHGHHHCTTTAGSGYRATDLVYVHYHYKPLAVLREHARAKLAPFVDVDDPAAVAAFEGPGNHLRSYLAMTEAEFQTWHRGEGFYRFTEFNEQLRQLGASIPF